MQALYASTDLCLGLFTSKENILFGQLLCRQACSMSKGVHCQHMHQNMLEETPILTLSGCIVLCRKRTLPRTDESKPPQAWEQNICCWAKSCCSITHQTLRVTKCLPFCCQKPKALRLEVEELNDSHIDHNTDALQLMMCGIYSQQHFLFQTSLS